MIRTLCLVLAFLPVVAMAAVTIQAPASVGTGAPVQVTVSGSTNPKDFLTIVPKGAAAGTYGDYVYLDSAGPRELVVPGKAGDYELRVLAADSPYPTLALVPLQVRAVTASLQAPAQVAAGAEITVRWTGPDNARDYVAIGNATRPYITYDYTRNANPVKLTAPDDAGAYELRYILGQGDVVIARQPITVGAVSASVTGPAQVAAGADFDVSWTGPGNDRDFVTLVKVGTPEKQYGVYEYTSRGPKLRLRAPDAAGDYELRYAAGQTYATLGRAPLRVTAVTATVAGPAQATAGTKLDVKWTGPGNENDYVSVVRKGAPDSEAPEYAYVRGRNPVRLVAPLVPGDYEIRYQLGQSHVALARAALKVVPGAQQPGFIQMAAVASKPSDRAVEVILDASGSMLQKLGPQRRIDIARQTLTKLVTSTLPAGTPLALRAFGREVDSCRSDLVLPLGPLDPAQASKVVASLDARNDARTAIGASLQQVTSDLRTAGAARVVIVVTDGEETCAGDPPAAIRALVRDAPRSVVHFVGFAVDDAKLTASFRLWAGLGNGSYFDARDGAALDRALTQALQPVFEVLDAAGQVVARGRAGGEPVQVAAGNWRVRLVGGSGESQGVTVRPGETLRL